MRLKKPIVAVSAVALMALAACGSSGGGNGATNTPGSGGNTTPTGGTSSSPSTGQQIVGQNPNAKPPAAPIPGAKKGGTLTVLSTGGITTMDPTEAYYTNTLSIDSGLVTRSLTQYQFNPKTKTQTLVPDLATSLGTPNKNFTSWTFTLRKGIKFENGKPVTPEDIKYGIERSFDRATFPNGANYSNQYFLHGNTYKGPYKSGTNYNGVIIKGMKITIKMAKPFPDMPYWGSFAAMGPIPPGKASTPSKYALHPWATGPYKFAHYVPNKSLVLVKNPYWKADTDPARRQYVNKIVFNFAEDESKIDQILLQDKGTAQTTISTNNVLAADYNAFQTKAPNRLVRGPYPCTFMWYPDNRKITNVNVRRAIGWAFPYRAVLNAGGSIPGVTAFQPYNVMPPGIAGRVQYNPLPGHTPWTTDPAKAKALLQKAGKLNYVLKWAYETDVPTSVAASKVEVAAFKAAGFNPQPVATTSSQYAEKYLQNPKADINIRSVGWCSDWPSGSSWIPPEFQSTDIKTNGFGTNYEAFNNKSIDNDMSKIQLLPRAQQPAAWNSLEKKIMLKYYPVIPTYYGANAMMTGSKVHGFYNDPNGGMPTWQTIWIG